MTPPFHSYQDAERFVRAAGYAPADPLRDSIAQARDLQHRYLAYLAAETIPVARVIDRCIEGPYGPLPVRLFVPGELRGRTPIVFLRGGGWWAGTLDTYARTMTLVCNASGLPVLGIDYRLTPEHQYPVQHDEVVASLRWLDGHAAELELSAGDVVLWGESAGATLAVCAARALHGARAPRVLGLVLFYGNFAGPGPNTRPYSRWVWQQYLGVLDPERADAAVPLRGDVRNLPPAWIGVGDADPLVSDSLELSCRLSEADVACELKIYPGMPHAFVMMNRFLQPAVAAIEDGSRAARRFAAASIHQEVHTGETR